jgi:CBS domain-containing protein
MSRNPVTASPNMGVGAAARLMAERGFGCLPVCEQGKLVGMVTTTDLLRRLGKVEPE